MAKAQMKLPEEFLLKIAKLGDQTDVIVPKALQAGGTVVLEKARSNLHGAIGRGTQYPSRSTGELVGALGLSPVKQSRSGDHDIKIGFSEPRRGGGVNAKIATILEYGKQGQPPRPFLRPARSSIRQACLAAMRAVLEAEMERV